MKGHPVSFLFLLASVQITLTNMAQVVSGSTMSVVHSNGSSNQLATNPMGSLEQRAANQTVLPDAATFAFIREAYFSAKSSTNTGSTTDPDEVEIRDALKRGPSGFRVPIEIRFGKHGRGVFLTEPARKGQMVRQSDMMTGIFYNAAEWQAFLSRLPKHLQNDVTVWAYVLEWTEDTPFVLGLDLDEGSLMNHAPNPEGDNDDDDTTESCANVQLNADRTELVAIRDLRAGEELFCDYRDFLTLDHDLSWYQHYHVGVEKD